MLYNTFSKDIQYNMKHILEFPVNTVLENKKGSHSTWTLTHLFFIGFIFTLRFTFCKVTCIAWKKINYYYLIHSCSPIFKHFSITQKLNFSLKACSFFSDESNLHIMKFAHSYFFHFQYITENIAFENEICGIRI